MRSKFFFRSTIITILYTPCVVWSQTTDSISTEQEINPIHINAYFSQQPILELTSAAHTISSRLVDIQQPNSLLPAINTVAGVRMEERSPGSYRLAMRGSLIRSAFGIRNAKIYIDDFPLTDAGGNTYLNLLDPAAIDAIHIIKGPDGSLYGANSGGVIHIAPNGFDVRKNRSSVLLSGGSFGLFQEQLSIQRKVNDNYSFSFDQSFTRSDGYRDNTALNKKTLQTAHRWKYTPKNEIRFLALYSDLGYRTPGGLTQAQMDENPRMSRPAAGPNPSAKEQQAGIYNKTFYGGIAHHAQLSDRLSHVISVFGSNTDFENPFITNYEYRTENNLGLRTYFSYRNMDSPYVQWQMQMGFEGQKGWNEIENYGNEKGEATDLEDHDNLYNTQYSFFYRTMAKIYQRWTIEGSLGLNYSKLSYHQHHPEIESPSGNITFGSIWMPRIATSYLITDRFAVRGSVSKGYSPPTNEEIRPSDRIINNSLRPETGTNYELGTRLETNGRRFIADLSIYRYKIKHGIVEQRNDDGEAYYLNAGEINQRGIEASIWAYILTPQTKRFIQTFNLHSSVSYNHYRFGNYNVNNNDFSRNKVTAVPDWVWSNTLLISLPKQFGLNLSHNFTSVMPLNDANTVFSEKFHLVQAKGTWTWRLKKRQQLQFFAGVDNLLNERYSLGNDINAFGDRFFNPAPTRNYYGGMKVIL
ncbi:TonB-dependent receptor [Sphingobacterium sp. DN00404]|uniref:TonB-dependent receptor n=1 Tax=Sphingobacterium micropteri TaxID=2763501 RepID=A0ABR7YJC7_9SPHI|nr:TonB-dependent receptor [Sphingobacterium micropteri]MBD1431293.1 TonB-dependent receptor [Sphingobacterium micropteri]